MQGQEQIGIFDNNVKYTHPVKGFDNLDANKKGIPEGMPKK
jgi:hypothetical protein